MDAAHQYLEHCCTEKAGLAILKRLMAKRMSQDILFSSNCAPEETAHSFTMLHGQKTERKELEMAVTSCCDDLLGTSETCQSPRKFASLRPTYSDEALASVILNTIVA